MITFICLLGLSALILTCLAALGAGFLVVFGDFIVCVALIVFLVKLFSKKNGSHH